MIQQHERVRERQGHGQGQKVREARGSHGEPVPTSYYGYPALKKPEWRWEIPLYFYTGGIAAGSYLAATLADLFGTEEDRPVSRVGRLVALVSLAVSPFLLIRDLGRPRRFASMLRVFKTRSPMSVGSWGLAGFGLFTGLGILRQMVEDGLVGRDSLPARFLGWVPLRVSGVLGSLFAFFVSSYTGVLLSFTNVPLWARNRLLQGPLFAASALSTGFASISLVLDATGQAPRRTRAWLEWTEKAATVGEIGLTAAALASLGPQARPLVSRRYGPPFWLGAVGLGLIAPMALRRQAEVGRGRTRQALRVASSVSVLVGGLIFRWVEVRAGQEQANDPEAYLTFARGR